MSKLLGVQKARFNLISHPGQDDLKSEENQLKKPPKAF